jgi:hypothetical protein
LSIIVALDGILRDQNGIAIPGSLKLYRSLLEGYRIILSTDSTFMEAERWCRINGIWDYAELYDKSKVLAGETVRASHLAAARASGGQVEFLVDSDSDNCVHALSVGVPSFFYAAPKLVARKPAIRAWEEITQTLDDQRAMAVGLDPELQRYE